MNTLIAEMTGQQYRSAVLCSAKNDVRYYLNGIYINFENSGVIATTGSYLYVAPVQAVNHPDSVEMDDFLKSHKQGVILVPVKLSVKVDKVEIYLVGKKYNSERFQFLVVTFSNNNELATYTVTNIPGNFPNYQQVMPEPLNESHGKVDSRSVSFNGEYLSYVYKIFGKIPIAIERSEDYGACRIFTRGNEYKGVFVLTELKPLNG